jgi:hypothetical protein
MAYDPDKTYNDLPLLPPKAELETKAVLRKAIAANEALAKLKGGGDLIPIQSVLINAIHDVPETNMWRKRVQQNRFFGHMPGTCPCAWTYSLMVFRGVVLALFCLLRQIEYGRERWL